MRKSAMVLAVALVATVFPSIARAQLLESLLFGAVSSGVNSMIAKGQERPVSAVKVVFDVYYIGNDDKLAYMVSWDPTTQTSVWFNDRVALRVKPFTNSGPAHDHTIYANDKLVEWRKVEGGRVVRGKPSGAKGVIGDYPLVYVRDLDMGFNQIKVRTSKTEWGSATFIRLDVRQFLQLASDEQARLSIAGAGQSTYPVVQSYTAQMPGGEIRNFASLEEFQMALGEKNNPPVSGGNSGKVGNYTAPGMGSTDGQQKVEDKPTLCTVTVGAMQTSESKPFEFYFDRLSEVERQLLNDAKRNTFKPEVEEIRLSNRRQQVVFAISDNRPFTGTIRKNGKSFPLSVRRNGNTTEALVWGKISNFLSTTIELTDADGRVRQLRFRMEEK